MQSRIKSIFDRIFRLWDILITGIPVALSVVMSPVRARDILQEAYEICRHGGFRALQNRLNRRRAGYPKWYQYYAELKKSDRIAIRNRILKLERLPLISVVLPVYNIQERWLRIAIDSILNQLYPHWELCIADDHSTESHIRPILEEYLKKDSRVKVVFRTTNGHISEATNSALELVTGEYIAFLDHDDELTEHALYMIAEEVNRYPQVDLIYTDQDRIDHKNRLSDPLFKPEWNPDLFYSQNYLNHLSVFRASIIKKIGGFQKEYDGSQDYDLILRFIEEISPENIRHIPFVLYHWRAIPGSVALNPNQKNYAHANARKAIQAHLERTKVLAKVVQGQAEYHRVVYPLPVLLPKVSVIIGTRDKVALLRCIVEGLLNQTDYSNLELIIIDNQSVETRTLDYFEELKTNSKIKIIPFDAPFNYSAMDNLGVKESSGEIIALLNNDLKIISNSWLKEMVSQALRPEVGIVGAKLYFGNDHIQHAGVVIGMGGVAGHFEKNLHKNRRGFMCRTHLVQSLSAVTGACLVMRKAVFQEVGGLDDGHLKVAFNDVDLCLKVTAKGYRIIFTPYAELYHLESASRGSDADFSNLSRFNFEIRVMQERWGKRLLEDPYFSPNLSQIESFAFAFPPRVTKPWEGELRLNHAE